MKITKAVIPVAGLGTRLLPITKSMPKEMLPLLDKPVIHYVVEEAMKSGLTDILLVIGKGKRAIIDYFDRSFDLEHLLKIKGNDELYKEIEEIGELVDLHYVQQKLPLGLGDAILHAENHVNDEPFAVLLGDDVIINETPGISQLLEKYYKYKSSIIGTETVPMEDVVKYGIISGKTVSPDMIKVDSMIEKPSIEKAPSNTAIIGRYILEPSVFTSLKKTTPGKNNELQLTDALINMLNKGDDIFAQKIHGKRYDIGTVLGFIQANFEAALLDDRYSVDLKQIISKLEIK